MEAYGGLETHTSILQPGLEADFPRLGLAHARATLPAEPLHQDLLQLGVILTGDLFLDLPAHAVGGTLVGHSSSLVRVRG